MYVLMSSRCSGLILGVCLLSGAEKQIVARQPTISPVSSLLYGIGCVAVMIVTLHWIEVSK